MGSENAWLPERQGADILPQRAKNQRTWKDSGARFHNRTARDRSRVLARIPSSGSKIRCVEAPDWNTESIGFALSRSEPLLVHLHGGVLTALKHNGSSVGGGERAAIGLERFTANRADILTSPRQMLVDELAA